jgi:CubicO group peptidase (beta-lactamase class C family)
LVHQGKLEWHKPVVNYLPDFQLQDPWISSNVTVVDLLSHRTGVASHDGIWDGDTINFESGRSVYQNLKYLTISGQFRNSDIYSNIMYGVIGHLIATVSGMPFVQFVTQSIFHPLGIKNFAWGTQNYLESTNKFDTHELDVRPGDKLTMNFKKIQPFDENIEFFYPAGALYTSTAEMTKWIQCLVQEGRNIQGKQVLFELDTILALHNVADVSKLCDFSYSGYGLGWCVSQYGHYPIYRHSGGMPGVETNVLICPKAQLGCYVAVNAGIGVAHPLSCWIASKIINFSDSNIDFGEKLDRIPDSIATQLQGEFEEFWNGDGDLQIHPRFDNLTAKYFHPAYGTVEILPHTKKGHLKLYRSPVYKTLYPNPKNNLSFFQIAAEGYLVGFQWEFSFLDEKISLKLQDDDVVVCFERI